MTAATSVAPAIPATQVRSRLWWGGGAALLALAGFASAWAIKSRPAEPAAPPGVAAPAVHATHAAKPATGVAACVDCATVDSVKPVQQKGKGTGAGAVVGGVLGGVVGHQMGGGSGKTAMTVLGALGGGVAGNEVEKRARSETVYQVQLRMDDGSRRTLTLSHPGVAAGDRVAVEGHNLRKLPATAASASS